MKKLFTVFMAVAMIFSLCTLSVLAASESSSGRVPGATYTMYAEVTSTFGCAMIDADCNSGTMQVETMCVAEMANGNWTAPDYDTSSVSGSVSTYASVSGSNIIAVCTEHHIYVNGSYVDTVGLDVYYGMDR